MSERLADIVERIDNMRQLDSVVIAMRGIAAARVQQSRVLIAGIDAYTGTISRAIGEALNLAPLQAQPHSAESCRRAVILFCAEQGFAGGFTDRLLDAAEDVLHFGLNTAKLIIVGTRGAAVAAERGISPLWTGAMANQIGNVAKTADRVSNALYAQIARGEISQVDVFFSRVDENRKLLVQHIELLPIGPGTFDAPGRQIAPLVSLRPEGLLAQLVEEYIYGRLCDAAMHSYAAENEARMQAMSSAGDNIDKTLGDLEQHEHQVRQEEVTAEIVELAAEVEAHSG